MAEEEDGWRDGAGGLIQGLDIGQRQFIQGFVFLDQMLAGFGDPPVDFLPMDDDLRRRLDAQTDLFAFNVNNSHPDIVTNADFLPNPACKYEHWYFPRRPALPDRAGIIST
jgi:hypothetical protein